MTTKNEFFFVDGITNLSYSAGAFRFDLAAIQPGRPEGDKEKGLPIESQAHVVMTPQAFIQTLKAMENFVKLVEEKGIIKFGEHGEGEHIAADK